MKRILIAAAALAIAVPAVACAGDSAAPFLTEQTASEWRMDNYIGKPVMNALGQHIGDIYDVLFDKNGQISTVVIGVGGFLGVGSKLIAVPYSLVTYSGTGDLRAIIVPLTREALMSAPAYKLSEKTTYDKVRETASEMAEKAGEKASELKDEAVKKLDEYRKK